MQIFEDNMTITTIICSIATIVAFIMMIWTEHKAHKNNELWFDAVNKANDGLKSDHDRLTTEHTALKNNLSTEHTALKNDLSKEHTALKSELGGKLDKLETRQEAIQTKVFDYISKEEGRRDKVQAVLPQQDVQLQIQLLYDKIAALSEENKEVRQQNQQIAELKQQIAELRQQLIELRRQNKNLNRSNHQLREQIKLQPQQFEQSVEDISRDEIDFYDEFGR